MGLIERLGEQAMNATLLRASPNMVVRAGGYHDRRDRMSLTQQRLVEIKSAHVRHVGVHDQTTNLIDLR